MAAKDSNQLPPRSGASPPPEEAIRQQLGKILISPQFVGSLNLQNFLRFIVEKTLAGGGAEIKGYTVATQVLGRKADFDPNLDPIVRIMAGRLRRALEQYYQVQGQSDAVIIDVPRGAYVPVFCSSSRQEDAGEVTLKILKEQIWALPPGPSVAVMPLRNLTGDRKQEFFADGLAEEITNELARYQDLRVIAFQSTLYWKGKEHDVREVGRDLNVRFLVEGSIRKAARTVKIAINVIDTLNGLRLWGEQYHRELRADSLIALQEEIALQVAARIGSLYGIIPQTLSRESRKKPPDSLKTYEAFLHFYHHVTILSPQTFAETLKVLERAVTRDPDSGLAWSLLAFVYSQSYSLQLAPLESPLEQSLVAAQKGAALEPENQLARVALANVYFFRNDRELFLSEAETALALNPNAPTPIGFLGWLLALLGDWERGLTILEKGMALNPHFPGWFRMAPFFYYYLQDSCEEAYQEALAFRMPQLFWDPLLRAAVLGRLGREGEGAQALAELLHLKPDFPTGARFLISCYAKFPYLVEGLLDGLRLVGLKT
ncbi:adenylate cyclase [Desulfobacca acetoxidans]|uniref:Adenylate cyclase n=1 Tax=Desulfobacca acetoxidans (strain ATCC 700848 / DSM 11109 / ASRB2) TaxID=880072 RepID=F2NFS0_DESAR|nr:adenylate cyclase [Desulfobacca acetoxidans]AEB10189.1 Adenylate cyclase [Desulfobacca acetoxidans DSM 11109]